jgi:hypothetical protein
MQVCTAWGLGVKGFCTWEVGMGVLGNVYMCVFFVEHVVTWCLMRFWGRLWLYVIGR